jgi:5'-deoxy-5'-methylthioadenosine phosphorylase
MLGIIGGTGLDRLDLIEDREELDARTVWGMASAPPIRGRVGQQSMVFLPRHGPHHAVAPHEINYRANLRALADAGVDTIVGVGTVGGIAAAPAPGGLAVPDQLIDYTWGRASTFFEGAGADVGHIDLTWPYTEAVRQRLLAAATSAGMNAVDGGCYGATQGPRLETAAEIRKLERDGCTLVGMTGMPEAALARELEIAYACCAVVVNPAAGKAATPISLDAIREQLERGMARVRALLQALGSS